MKKSSSWGGNLELFAVQQIYSVDIHIYQYEAPCLQMKNSLDNCQIIFLSYHDNEHYNSVRKIDHNDDLLEKKKTKNKKKKKKKNK